jgi:ABC-type lipoprotein export system ATPase subunit
MTVLRAQDLTRRFGDVTAVSGVSLAVDPGEWVSLVGPSGCGKTTLLQMLGLLDRPTSGELLFAGIDPRRIGAAARTKLRCEKIGFVFQGNNLVDHLTALENVALPSWRLHGSRVRAFAAAGALLERLGLSKRAGVRAAALSMGEAQRVAMQRVAIARALINRPALVLADEPTGSLDSALGETVLSALAEVCAAGAALLVVTHEAAVAARGQRIVSMADGRIAR